MKKVIPIFLIVLLMLFVTCYSAISDWYKIKAGKVLYIKEQQADSDSLLLLNIKKSEFNLRYININDCYVFDTTHKTIFEVKSPISDISKRYFDVDNPIEQFCKSTSRKDDYSDYKSCLDVVKIKYIDTVIIKEKYCWSFSDTIFYPIKNLNIGINPQCYVVFYTKDNTYIGEKYKKGIDLSRDIRITMHNNIYLGHSEKSIYHRTVRAPAHF